MQSVSSRIWTRVAVSISYDDNYYTMGTSSIIIIIVDLINNLCTKIESGVSNPVICRGRKNSMKINLK